MKVILATLSLCSVFFSSLNNTVQRTENHVIFFYNDTTKTKGKAKPFEYPDEATTDSAKKRFEQDFKKGKILYEINCAKCHNVKENKKMEIPDFSLPQLMDYEIRFQYPAHENNMKETNITHDELDQIVQYLRYKKRSGIPYKLIM